MSEARWFIKTMPDKEGYYFQESPSGKVIRVHMAGDAGGCRAYCDYYGPIPEPPKEPPKIRRFMATYNGTPVSGVLPEGWTKPNTFQWENGKACCRTMTVPLSQFDDLVWLDEE